MANKNGDTVRVRIFARTFFSESTNDFSGGPGYTGAPSLNQLPGSAANRRLLASRNAGGR